MRISAVFALKKCIQNVKHQLLIDKNVNNLNKSLSSGFSQSNDVFCKMPKNSLKDILKF